MTYSKNTVPVTLIRSLMLIFVLVGSLAQLYAQERSAIRMEKRLLRRSSQIDNSLHQWKHLGSLAVDSIVFDKKNEQIHYYLNSIFSQIPARYDWIESLQALVKESVPKRFRSYRISLSSNGHFLEEYIPNAFRRDPALYDKSRMASQAFIQPWVLRDNAPVLSQGLQGRHIAIWPSHGLYFDQKTDRWRWQRARLWQTVEDIFPWIYTTQYLVPMLEHSGAVVALPRERDTQVNEIIVDADQSTGNSRIEWSADQSGWVTQTPGFMKSDTLFPGENPFLKGTGQTVHLLQGDSASALYIPEIPETGDYAVYVSYLKSNECVSSVKYEVRYSGGTQLFTVNQCMGAGTWLYLGTFRFEKGLHSDNGFVRVFSNQRGNLSTDAVRFGGGMGNVVRRPSASNNRFLLSNKPRWTEGSRYFLQYSGMPDTLVYGLNKDINDYNDDYMSRPEWVNFLLGNSRPQYSGRYASGLNIPVDIAIALHTDAGVTSNDSVIGTLSIFSTTRNSGKFPDGSSKLASRDLADIIQTQLVDDIRYQINQRWVRRGMWDREYSEAWRPVVPVMMLEMLSHQNMADMQYGLDPRFQFLASRAIYKGIVRYFAASDNKAVVIQPLPPDHMEIKILGGKRIQLCWSGVSDPLEPSAIPASYVVYKRSGNSGFDAGIAVKDTSLIIELPEWNTLYSFKVAAFNEGGESMPGEILSAAIVPGADKPVLVVNAFDRVSAPAFFDKDDMAGMAWWDDEGVPRGIDFSFTGYQFNFSRNAEWISDDNQGWGASYADMECLPVTGNTFDFTSVHGKALLEAGYSFTSMSDEVFEKSKISAQQYTAVDIIFGEERGTLPLGRKDVKEFRVFTPPMIRSLSNYLNTGGNLFISGSYIGTDMSENGDTAAVHFASDILHYTWVTNHATRIGKVDVAQSAYGLFPKELKFNTEWGKSSYRVEAPDGIDIADDDAFRIYRYTSGNAVAGVAYKGTYKSVAFGFPFESISEEQQMPFMKSLMQFFTEDQKLNHLIE